MVWTSLLALMAAFSQILGQIVMFKHTFELKYGITPQESLEINPMLQFFADSLTKVALSNFRFKEDQHAQTVRFLNNSFGYPLVQIDGSKFERLGVAELYLVFDIEEVAGEQRTKKSPCLLTVVVHVKSFYQPNFEIRHLRVVYPEQVDVLTKESAKLEVNLPKVQSRGIKVVSGSVPQDFSFNIAPIDLQWERLVLRKPDYSSLRMLMVFGDLIIAEFALEDSFTSDQLRIIKLYSLLNREIKLEVDSNEVAYQEEMEGNLHNIRSGETLELVPSLTQPFVLVFKAEHDRPHTKVSLHYLSSFGDDTIDIDISFEFSRCWLHEFPQISYLVCQDRATSSFYLYRLSVFPFWVYPVTADTHRDYPLGSEIPAVTTADIVKGFQQQLTHDMFEIPPQFLDHSQWSVHSVDLTYNSTESPSRQIRARGLARFAPTGHHVVFGFYISSTNNKHAAMKIFAIWEPGVLPSMFTSYYDQIYYFVDGEGLFSTKQNSQDRLRHFESPDTNLEYVKHQKFEHLGLLFIVKRDKTSKNMTCSIHKLSTFQKSEQRIYFECERLAASDIDADWSESLPDSLRIIYYTVDPVGSQTSRGTAFYSARVYLDHPSIAAMYSPLSNSGQLIPADQLSSIFKEPFEIQLKINNGYSPILWFRPPDESCNLRVAWRNHTKPDGTQIRYNSAEPNKYVMSLSPGDAINIPEVLSIKGPIVGTFLDKSSHEEVVITSRVKQTDQIQLEDAETGCLDWRILEKPGYFACIDATDTINLYFNSRKFQSFKISDVRAFDLSNKHRRVDIRTHLIHIHKDHLVLIVWSKLDSVTYYKYPCATLLIALAKLPSEQSILDNQIQYLNFTAQILPFTPIALRDFTDNDSWRVKTQIHKPTDSLMMLVKFKKDLRVFLYPLKIILANLYPSGPLYRKTIEEREFSFGVTLDQDAERSNLLSGMCDWLNDSMLVLTSVAETENLYVSVLGLNPQWDINQEYPTVPILKEIGQSDSYLVDFAAGPHGAYHLRGLRFFDNQTDSELICRRNTNGKYAVATLPILMLQSLTNMTTIDICMYIYTNSTESELPTFEVQISRGVTDRPSYYLPVVDEYIQVLPLLNYFVVIKSPSRSFGTFPSSTTSSVQSVGYLFEARNPNVLAAVSFPYSSNLLLFGVADEPDAFWMFDSQTGQYSLYRVGPLELKVPHNISCVPGNCNTLVRLVFKSISPLTSNIKYDFKLQIKPEEPTLMMSLKSLRFWKSKLWTEYWSYLSIALIVLLVALCFCIGKYSVDKKKRDNKQLKNLAFYPTLNKIVPQTAPARQTDKHGYRAFSVLST